MIVHFIKSCLKGAKDSLFVWSLNPLFFQLKVGRPLSKYSDFFLICRIKHEAHLLEKATKNPYVKGRGGTRSKTLASMISEYKKRGTTGEEVLSWAEAILEQYGIWRELGTSQHVTGIPDFSNMQSLSVPSIRFWSDEMPERSAVLSCIEAAQAAPASCNRQAFLVRVLSNAKPNFSNQGARNASMFDTAPYRVFLFINRRNYVEKYAAFIDIGMFAQNFILKAKTFSLGCCCCYASEHIDHGQGYWRSKFDLSNDYYCALTILVGFPTEIATKPPRLKLETITKFYEK